jgi:hypothetical protein
VRATFVVSAARIIEQSAIALLQRDGDRIYEPKETLDDLAAGIVIRTFAR